MQNVELVKPPNGLRSSGAPDQCRRTFALAVMQQLKRGKTFEQLTSSSPKRARSRTHFAQHGDGQGAALNEPVHNRVIKRRCGKKMTGDQLHRRPRGQTRVQIEHLKATLIGHPVRFGETRCLGDRHIGSINRQHRETALREPHRAATDTAGKVKGRPGAREEIGDVNEARWHRRDRGG